MNKKLFLVLGISSIVGAFITCIPKIDKLIRNKLVQN